MSIFDKKTQRDWAKAINRIEVDGKKQAEQLKRDLAEKKSKDKKSKTK